MTEVKSRRVVLLIGPSGCGKSTRAKEEVRRINEFKEGTAVVVSADDFYIQSDGTYQYDPARASMAHADCFTNFMAAIKDPSIECIFVDNTNTRKWERQKYTDVCSMLGIAVELWMWRIITIQQLRCCIASNVHNVPVSVICDMVLRLEVPDYEEGQLYYVDANSTVWVNLPAGQSIPLPVTIKKDGDE
jgi:predicted kinase